MLFALMQLPSAEQTPWVDETPWPPDRQLPFFYPLHWSWEMIVWRIRMFRCYSWTRALMRKNITQKSRDRGKHTGNLYRIAAIWFLHVWWVSRFFQVCSIFLLIHPLFGESIVKNCDFERSFSWPPWGLGPAKDWKWMRSQRQFRLQQQLRRPYAWPGLLSTGAPGDGRSSRRRWLLSLSWKLKKGTPGTSWDQLQGGFIVDL